MSKLSDLLNSQPVSARQAADVAKERGIPLPYGTLAGYWAGTHGRPTARTLERLAEVLPIPLAQLQMAAWNRTAPLGPYTPPPEANLLGDRQRKAIDELIKAMAEGVDHGAGTEEVTEPRAEAGSPVDGGEVGGDRGRPGAPIGAAATTKRVKITHLQRKNQGHSHDSPTATDPGAVNVAGKMPPPNQLQPHEILAAHTSDDPSGMYPDDEGEA